LQQTNLNLRHYVKDLLKIGLKLFSKTFLNFSFTFSGKGTKDRMVIGDHVKNSLAD